MGDRDRRVPRGKLAEFTPSPRSAIEILTEQNEQRIQRLVPLRFERMRESAFAFFRGSAAVMAADLTQGPDSGIEVLSCGDAHVSNFGVYAAPDRALLFDLNDFDEVAFAPAEWDVKRLATSVLISGRHRGQSERSIEPAVRRALTTYQRALRRSVRFSPVERYYRRVEPERASVGSDDARHAIEHVVRRARTKTSERAFAKLTEIRHGQRRWRESPVLQRLEKSDAASTEALMAAYVTSVPVDVAYLLSQYRLADVALRVVGVGSVGTRCLVAALLGPGDAPLVLQIKEASASVLERYGERPQPNPLRERVAARGEGARVVGGQRVMQAGSDVFLGSFRHQDHDYYVRQFHDQKGSADLDGLSRTVWSDYASACAAVLAYAHARSPRAGEFSEYLGTSAKGLSAIRRWSYAYADKAADDYERFANSVDKL